MSKYDVIGSTMTGEQRNQKLPSVFTEMLMSFVALGSSLNLSHAVETLGVSRQTIRRHIRELEQIKGGELFTLEDRQYQLTDLGQNALASARNLLSLSTEWLLVDKVSTGGLAPTSIVLSDTEWIYIQPHPVINVWTDGVPLLQRGLSDIISSKCQLDHEALEVVRPYALVYREFKDEWICVEVGNKSAYASWVGLSMAKSGLGRDFSRLIKSEAIHTQLLEAYQNARESGGLWYDHVCISVPRSLDGAAVPISYQRLITACSFADGDPAVLILAARTNGINIPALPPERHIKVSEDMLMDFAI